MKKSSKKQAEKKFPPNFIERILRVFPNQKEIEFEFKANTSFDEYSEERVWNDAWLTDIRQISLLLLRYLTSHQPDSLCPYYNKKIVSLDIETTDFIPKAREGFVNTIGLSILDCRESVLQKTDGEYKCPELILHQSFNMLRKKESVPNLLHLAWPYIADADLLLVFNSGFDISILTNIIQNYQLPYKFPSQIIDLMKTSRSLDILEQALEKQIHFRRNQTQKGVYSEYYKLFKGQGSKGTNKQIEPLGAYNLMDTLTPLFYYIINAKKMV